MQIVFEPPSKDSPGFLKRLKKAMAFQDAINSKNITEKTIDDLVDFLSVCIQNETPEKAKELLLDASETQFNEMLASITGQQSEDDTKKNGNTLNYGTKAQAKKHR